VEAPAGPASSREVAIEDFPALDADDLEFARMFVELGRPQGRPRKLKFVRGDG
jgi:hypothetical protein